MDAGTGRESGAGLQVDCPPHPRPLSPVPGARGGICVFEEQWRVHSTPRPWQGRGAGGEGCRSPACILHSRSSGFPARDPPRKVTCEGCFFNHRGHRDHRGHRGKTVVVRPPGLCVCDAGNGGVPGRLSPSPPDLSPPRGGDGRIGCQWAVSVAGCEVIIGQTRSLIFAASRLRVRNRTAAVAGVCRTRQPDWTSRQGGMSPPHPRPLSPSRGRGEDWVSVGSECGGVRGDLRTDSAAHLRGFPASREQSLCCSGGGLQDRAA